MNLMTHIIISMTLCLSMIGAYHFQFARDTPTIVTVDVNQLIEEKIQALTKRGNSEEKNKRLITQFGQSIEQEIKRLSQKSNVIVLPSQAVLAGGQDLTHQLKQRMVSQ